MPYHIKLSSPISLEINVYFIRIKSVVLWNENALLYRKMQMFQVISFLYLLKKMNAFDVIEFYYEIHTTLIVGTPITMYSKELSRKSQFLDL